MREKRESILWNPEMEAMPLDRLRELQWKRIRERLHYLESRSSFYGAKFEEAGLKAAEIQDLEMFKARVPFSTKEEVKVMRQRTGDPYGGLLCVSPDQIVHLIRTAGTTGLPTLYGVTQKDLHTLGELSARMWYQIGARTGDTVAIGTFGSWNAFSITLLEGLRTAGIRRYHFSMPAPGEEVFPLEILPNWVAVQGIYLSARPLWQITEKYGSKLAEMVPSLRYLFMAGRRVTASFRRGIENLWGTHLFEAYPMTDAGLLSSDCTEQTETFHFPEDAFLVEIVDPDTGEDLTGTGRVGEIVVTALTLEGTPLFRFRSEDMGFTSTTPCRCGRTGMRLGLSERMAHSVDVKGRPVYSSEVEEVLYGIPEFFLKQYHMVKKKDQPQESLLLRVERPSEMVDETHLREQLVDRLKKNLEVETQVEFFSGEDERFVAAYKFLTVVSE